MISSNVGQKSSLATRDKLRRTETLAILQRCEVCKVCKVSAVLPPAHTQPSRGRHHAHESLLSVLPAADHLLPSWCIYLQVVVTVLPLPPLPRVCLASRIVRRIWMRQLGRRRPALYPRPPTSPLINKTEHLSGATRTRGCSRSCVAENDVWVGVWVGACARWVCMPDS